jgi:transposase-like protein
MKEKRDNKKGICQRCNGTGFSRQFNRNPKYSKEIRKKCVELFDKDLSLREIAKRLKLKHPQTVKNILLRD